MASSPAVMLTGSGQKDGRFGTAIAALGDINFDRYNGDSAFLYILTQRTTKTCTSAVKHKVLGLRLCTINFELDITLCTLLNGSNGMTSFDNCRTLPYHY